MVERLDAGLGRRALLACDVDRRGGIVADEHGREPRRVVSGLQPRGDLVGDLRAHLLRDRLPVDDRRRHQAREASARGRLASARASTASVIAQKPASSRYGTRSPSASASRALPASPTACPVAHARLTSAKAKPWAMPNASAPSLSIAIAGV